MVKWKDLWLTKRDSNDVIIGLCTTKKMPIMLDVLFAVLI